MKCFRIFFRAKFYDFKSLKKLKNTILDMDINTFLEFNIDNSCYIAFINFV